MSSISFPLSKTAIKDAWKEKREKIDSEFAGGLPLTAPSSAEAYQRYLARQQKLGLSGRKELLESYKQQYGKLYQRRLRSIACPLAGVSKHVDPNQRVGASLQGFSDGGRLDNDAKEQGCAPLPRGCAPLPQGEGARASVPGRRMGSETGSQPRPSKLRLG